MTLEDIEMRQLHDGGKRAVLDTYEKIYFWVNHRFEEQKKAKRGELIIDFSDTIILLENNEHFNISKLCGNIDGIYDLRSEEEKEIDGENIIQRLKSQFEIRRKIAFDGAILYNAWFYDTIFCRVTNFTATKFMAGANFSGSIFNDAVSFNQIDISQKPHEEDKEKLPFLVGTAINFTHIHFKGPVYFNNLKWESAPYLNFSENTYESEVRFIECSIDSPKSTYYDFSNSVFKGDLIIDGGPKDKSLISRFLLSACHFHKKLKIWKTTIGEIDMTNSNFHDTVNITCYAYNEASSLNFSFSTIDCLFLIDSIPGDSERIKLNIFTEISFYKAIFTSKSSLFFRGINNNTHFPQAGVLNFVYANILGTITIQDSKLKCIDFEKSTNKRDFTIQDSILNLLKLSKANITGNIAAQDSKIKHIELKKGNITGNFDIEDKETKFDCREGFTKIKNGYIKKNDLVNSSFYKGLEMKKYCKELCENTWKDIKKVKLFKVLKNLPNLFLLGLNGISNNYGRWWMLGVFFTIIVGFIFYSFFAVASNPALEFSVDYSNWLIGDSYYWKKVLCFLWLPNFDGIKELTDPQNNTSIWGCIWFFLGKIFVAYGYYQTVSAFRKYGK